MKGVLYIIKRLWTFLFTVRKYMPKFMAGLFIVSTFFYNLFNEGFSYAMRELALSLVTAELVINENVSMAIAQSPEYGIYHFIEIIFSFMVVWYLIKYITKLFVKISGSQAEWGAILLAVIGVALIEYVGVVILLDDFSFIPIYDGIFFCFLNFQSVVLNINWFNFDFMRELVTTQSDNTSINTTITENISNNTK